jgi:hypothetical protein
MSKAISWGGSILGSLLERDHVSFVCALFNFFPCNGSRFLTAPALEEKSNLSASFQTTMKKSPQTPRGSGGNLTALIT